MDVIDIIKIEEARRKEKLSEAELESQLRSEFYEDLNNMWNTYCKLRYGIFAFWHKRSIWNTVLWSVYYDTELLDYNNFWFNKKWMVKTLKHNRFKIEKLKTRETFIIKS